MCLHRAAGVLTSTRRSYTRGRCTHKYRKPLTQSLKYTHEYRKVLHRAAGVLRSTLKCYTERQVYSRVHKGVTLSGRCTHEYMKLLTRMPPSHKVRLAPRSGQLLDPSSVLPPLSEVKTMRRLSIRPSSRRSLVMLRSPSSTATIIAHFVWLLVR